MGDILSKMGTPQMQQNQQPQQPMGAMMPPNQGQMGAPMGQNPAQGQIPPHLQALAQYLQMIQRQQQDAKMRYQGMVNRGPNPGGGM